MINKEQWDIGMSLFQKFMKKVGIVLDGKKVDVTYNFEFPDEKTAKTFAEAMKKSYGV
jgi:hypothetical protein